MILQGLGLRFLVVTVLVAVGIRYAEAAPSIYTAPAYESPVRGDPDDLLLIPGYGLSATDRIVYQAVANTTQLPAHPSTVPTMSSAALGVADVVNASDAPYSLAVHLPAVMTAGQSYVLWVLGGGDDQWSAPILINDARPLWITPDTAYESAQLANLPRELKVVGRNLQPAPGSRAATQVRLIGVSTGTTYTLTAKNTSSDPGNTTDALERYAAVVTLPATLVADQYTVQVSRDGTSWVALLGNGQSPAQTLTVRSNPVTPSPFNVGDPKFADPVSGQCKPNDGIDDTYCILEAIGAAVAAGGGTVFFDSGTWTMSVPGTFRPGASYSDRMGFLPGQCPRSSQLCGVSWYGVLLPVGVNIQGNGPTGPNATIIEQGTGWNMQAILSDAGPLPLFTLRGNNSVSGIAFVDGDNYLSMTGAPLLKLGVNWWFQHGWGGPEPVTVSNIVITNNLFVRPFVAIGNGGLPMDHVYITDNTFGGAYNTAVNVGWGGNQLQNLLPAQTVYPYSPYQFSDSVVAHNTFYPSSYQGNAATGAGGSIASQINTGLRVDFSNNVADGTVTQYLYDPDNDPPGWRAAFFFSTGLNQEMTLVSNNQISCPGDKDGDGEAIAFDGSDYFGGVPAAQPVTGSAPWTNPRGLAGTTVTLQGTIITSFTVGNPEAILDISSNPGVYYRGFWAQVVQGKGKGQWRKIESVSVGSNSSGPTVALSVTPAFDVPPDSTSRVNVQYGWWQNVTVNNYINQGSPCTKNNHRLGGRGGMLTWYDGTADSAMEGNQQYDTSGIFLNHRYDEPSKANHVYGTFQTSNEIRGNLLQGDYHWDWQYSGGHAGGIQLDYGAFECAGSCPAPLSPNLGFGITIAHNTIKQADATDARESSFPPIGAIGLNSGWSTGALDASGASMPEMGEGTLIFHNSVQNVSNAMAGSPPAPHVGIGIDVADGTRPHSATAWNSTLYANTCSNVDIPMSDFGIGTKRVCPSGAAASCECAGVSSADVGVMATSSLGPTPDGGNMTYTVAVTNHSSSVTASGVTLTVEPSAGVQIHGASLTSSAGTCDLSVNVCSLRTLSPNATITVTLTASLPVTGTWPVTFSVGHHEADSVVTNDSTTVAAGIGPWGSGPQLQRRH